MLASTTWLSRFVEDVRVIEAIPGRELKMQRIPDGRTLMTLRVMDGGQTGDLTVSGPRTRAKFKTSSGVARAITLQFKPGWSTQLLGVAASSLTDRIVLLEDLWGRTGGALCDELLDARSVAEVLGRLSHAIEARADGSAEPASARLARRAVRLIEGGEARVDSVATQLGVTARHLRRAFTESIGVGPKDYARTVRLQRALRSAATSNDWVGIAAHAGYYDQAHLIGDFRELIGITPAALVRCAPLSPPARPSRSHAAARAARPDLFE